MRYNFVHVTPAIIERFLENSSWPYEETKAQIQEKKGLMLAFLEDNIPMLLGGIEETETELVGWMAESDTLEPVKMVKALRQGWNGLLKKLPNKPFVTWCVNDPISLKLDKVLGFVPYLENNAEVFGTVRYCGEDVTVKKMVKA